MSCSSQLTPVKYAQWGGKQLFPDGTRPTVTHITTNGRGERCAYGFRTDNGYCFYFYITFADATEEQSFIEREWKAWRTSDPTAPHIMGTDPPGEPPPECNTPWTPQCGDPQVIGPTPPPHGRGQGRAHGNPHI